MTAAKDWTRSYGHWRHAEALLDTVSDEFQRTDIVTTLKRAIDVRMRALSSAYEFKRIPLADLPEGQLEQLAHLGVLRPLLIGRLIEIRNRIEHQDVEPPTLSHCRELVDVVWYFLRSTDGILRQVIKDVMLDQSGAAYDEPYFLCIGVNPPNNWQLGLRGWFPAAWVTTTAKPGWLIVEATKAERVGDQPRLPSSEFPEASSRMAKRQPDDIYLEGRGVGPSSVLLALYQYFLGVR